MPKAESEKLQIVFPKQNQDAKFISVYNQLLITMSTELKNRIETLKARDVIYHNVNITQP